MNNLNQDVQDRLGELRLFEIFYNNERRNMGAYKLEAVKGQGDNKFLHGTIDVELVTFINEEFFDDESFEDKNGLRDWYVVSSYQDGEGQSIEPIIHLTELQLVAVCGVYDWVDLDVGMNRAIFYTKSRAIANHMKQMDSLSCSISQGYSELSPFHDFSNWREGDKDRKQTPF